MICPMCAAELMPEDACEMCEWEAGESELVAIPKAQFEKLVAHNREVEREAIVKWLRGIEETRGAGPPQGYFFARYLADMIEKGEHK